jgi:Skp family chaperone for outer membrane proteins
MQTSAREVRHLRAEVKRREEDFAKLQDGFQSHIEELQDRSTREIQGLRARVQFSRVLQQLLHCSMLNERKGWERLVRELQDDINTKEKLVLRKAYVKERQEYIKRHNSLIRMCKQFGWTSAIGKGKVDGWAKHLTGREDRKDEDLLDAAFGFWQGSQKGGVAGKEGRAGAQFRMGLLHDVVKHCMKGELWEKIRKDIQKDNRACPVAMAKKQDTECAFNRRALQGIRECLPGYRKGAMGLALPSQTTVDKPKAIVQRAAELEFGSVFPEEHGGEFWHWDFEKGVHDYLKRKYWDMKSESVTEGNPWKISVTGDEAKVSARGAKITVCGLKICDGRHAEQNGTGKAMNQSPLLYTPTICTTTGNEEEHGLHN